MNEEIKAIIEEIIISKLYNEYDEEVVDDFIRDSESLISPEISNMIDDLLIATSDRVDELLDDLHDVEQDYIDEDE